MQSTIMRSALFLLLAAFLFGCGSGSSEVPAANAEDEQHASPATDSTHQHEAHEHHHHHHDANHHMHQRPIEELIAAFDAPERDAWQKPDAVLDLLEPLEGKTVADIGAGSGYFALRLAERGATVLALDIDDRFLEHIKAQAAARELSNIETRKVPENGPGMDEGEADAVMIVNTYHHIHQRAHYFAQVRKALRSNGVLMVVDYAMKETAHGPPMELRMPPAQVEAELLAAGFTTVTQDSTTLPYQYIIVAQ